MKRILFLTLALMVVLSGMAFATQTRVETMGMVNNIVIDDANIWLYPQTVVKYGGLFTVESNDEDAFHMGANWDMKNYTLGLYFSEDSYYTYYNNSDGNSNMDHRMTLLYGRELGGNPFGFAFNYYGEGRKNEDAFEANNFDWNMGRWEVGFGYTLMEGKLDLAAGYGKNMWNDEVYDGDALAEATAPDGNSSLNIMGRYWMEGDGNWMYIPHASFMSHTEGLEYYDGSGDVAYSNEWKYSQFDIGFGTNYNVSDDVMTVTDFGVVMEKETETYAEPDDADAGYEYEYKYTHLPYFKIGLDAKVKSWLDFRCGVTTIWDKYNYTFTDDNPDNTQDRTYTDADTDIYLGFGMHWGDFTLDGMMDDSELLHNGPYFLTGADSDEMAYRLSITYKFD